MSAKLVKSPIFATLVVVGLVGVTALVAGYVDRPGTDSVVAATDAKCTDCPKEGTSECSEAKGSCSTKADCSDGGCAKEAALTASTCSATSGGAAGCPMTVALADAPGTCASQSGCAEKAASADTCAKSAAEVAEGGCGGGTCPVAK